MEASSASAGFLELTEVLGWFSEPIQRKGVLNRFITAQSATKRHPDAWARENWVEACKNMRGVISMKGVLSGQEAFNIVCTLLEQHSKELEENPSNSQPGNHQPGGAKARPPRRQVSADQQPSALPDAALDVVPKGLASDLPPADVTLTALQGARAAKKRLAPPWNRPAMKKSTAEHSAKLAAFQEKVLGILDTRNFITIRAINEEIRRKHPLEFPHMIPLWLWKRTNPYPIATACSTRQQPEFEHERRHYSYIGASDALLRDLHFYGILSSVGDGSHGTGGGGSDPGDDNTSGHFESEEGGEGQQEESTEMRKRSKTMPG
jgi:hypothetical protein